ncbi:MAG TPA: hypothetical protein VER58_11235 [Thermoanaerobaculia bacterium]|nr:hypothetical protein [Thermoanaerobaculia bacterium]
MRFATLLLALHASVALAGDTWVALTPNAAPFGTSVVAADPFAPDTLYADAFYIAGMSKSTDGGKNWDVLPFNVQLLRKIIVETSAPNRVTAMAWDMLDYSVYRSTNGGLTWVRYQSSGAVIGILNDIAVDPLDSSILYAAHARSCLTSCIADSGGVTKSSDGGRHWTALFKGVGIQQVFVDPFGSGTIYAVGTISRRSQNGGLTWTDLASPGGEAIFRMALDPVVPDVLYASTFQGFWRSDDRGDTWRQLGSPFAIFPAWSIAIDPIRRGVIVAGGGNGFGVKRSMDGGQTWQPLNEGLAVPQAPAQLDFIQVFFAPNGKLYGVAGFQGVMKLNAASEPRRRPVRH